MTTINELSNILSQLSCNISDEIFASKIREIQTMVAKIQSDQTELVEKRIKLMMENEDLKKQIDTLKEEILNLKYDSAAI